MPRPLVFGNGSMLIQLDARHRIRDLFFPYVGQYNHLAGHAIRMGVWREGRFSWCDSDEWQIHQSYMGRSNMGQSQLVCDALQLQLVVEEAIDPEVPLFVRNITVKNLAGPADIRLFFAQDLRLNESDIGDTALFHSQGSIIHYKNRVALLFGGSWGTGGIYQVQCAARHGDWPASDAHDGDLGGNLIEQGSVASVFSLRHDMKAGETAVASFWIAAATELPTVLKLGSQEKLPSVLAKNRVEDQPITSADDGYDDLVHRGLQVILSQTDARGAILAANDSDILATARATYSYLWMRDGGLVASVLDREGQHETTEKFFDLCLDLLPQDPPMFLHKYGPDGSLGASWHPYQWHGRPIVPFQEDSTALVVWALGEHMKTGGNVENLAKWYPRLVHDVCNYMASYINSSGLPLPSWDCWEERRGVHAYTAATVIAALRAGAELAHDIGDSTGAGSWLEAADRMTIAVKEKLWNAENGHFWRMLEEDGTPDTTLDSATLAIGLFGILAPNDPPVVQNADTIQKALSVGDGLARYENDYYFRQRDGYPGNPWVITTMWLAQTRILQGDLGFAERALRWVRDHQEPTGILAEQYHPDTGEPLSVSPLTWSHAEVIRTVQLLRQARSTLQA